MSATKETFINEIHQEYGTTNLNWAYRCYLRDSKGEEAPRQEQNDLPGKPTPETHKQKGVNYDSN